MTEERFEVLREIAAQPAEIFALLCSPEGHVSIDSTGMLQSAEGEAVTAVGDEFVVHMDRESLNDFPEMGKYDVTVTITAFEKDAHIAWTVGREGQAPIDHRYGYRLVPSVIGTSVTSYYDWSQIPATYRDMGLFPILPESVLRASLGMLARTVAKQ